MNPLRATPPQAVLRPPRGNLRPCVSNASPPRRAAFLSRAKATKVEPGNAEGTALVRQNNVRAGLQVGDLHTRMCSPSRGGFPRHSFHAPDYLSRNITDPHEAGAPVPPLSAQAGATFHSIPLAGCPASLPPFSFKTVDRAHVVPRSFVSRKPNVTGKPLHNAQEKIAADE